MCLLTYYPEGTQPDVEALHNGAVFNDDGHGWAVVVGDHIVTDRGMQADPIIEGFAAMRARHPDGPALFHSRYGTHGTNTVDNCHPFPVGGDRRTIVAHNGVMPNDVQPGKGDIRSDTRIMAEDWLPAFGTLTSKRARARFGRWMTTYNKVVILTVDPSYRDRSYIINEGSGIWDDGIWYSNDGYRPLVTGFVAPCDGVSLACWYCGEPISSISCGKCGTCQDCGEDPDYCRCSHVRAEWADYLATRYADRLEV